LLPISVCSSIRRSAKKAGKGPAITGWPRAYGAEGGTAMVKFIADRDIRVNGIIHQRGQQVVGLGYQQLKANLRLHRIHAENDEGTELEDYEPKRPVTRKPKSKKEAESNA
jgi:hypothetical protein